MNTRTPKYAVVENQIENAILQKTFFDKLPGERALAKTFQVSYMTLRKAIENLVAKGLLYKVPTRGTFVVDLNTMDEDKTQSLEKSESYGAQSKDFQVDEKSVNELRREIRELRRANQVLQKVASYYANAQHAA